MDIIVRPGQIFFVRLTGAFAETLTIFDNSRYMDSKPSVTLEGFPDYASAFATNPSELVIKIDCTNCYTDYQIYAINSGNNVLSHEVNRKTTKVALDKDVSAVDINMLKDVVVTIQKDNSVAAERNAGFPVMYYKAETLQRLPYLSSDTLKTIKEANEIKVVFPKAPIMTSLDFDQFGIKYESITNLHVVKETWLLQYPNTEPTVNDIVFMPIVEQLFEVSNVDAKRAADGSILYFDLTMKFITDRNNIHKDKDLLDLSGLAYGMDKINEQKVGVISNKTSAIFGLTKLEETESVDIDAFLGYHLYAIAFVNNQWLKLHMFNDGIADQIVEANALDGTAVQIDVPNFGPMIDVAKFVQLNDALDAFKANTFYTSLALPPFIQALTYINHVKPK